MVLLRCATYARSTQASAPAALKQCMSNPARPGSPVPGKAGPRVWSTLFASPQHWQLWAIRAHWDGEGNGQGTGEQSGSTTATQGIPSEASWLPVAMERPKV